jgi:hypothetical protein
MLKLVTYPSSSHGPAGLSLGAQATLEGSGQDRKLVLTYAAGGALEKILWPASLTSKPQRKDELWKHTCFEAFIKPKGQDSYWEINLSPTGDWNVYRFSSYRNGMAREEAVQTLRPIFTKQGDQWHLSCEIWIPAWANAAGLEIGLTSVIEDTLGEISYWAIAHAGTRPDFHLAQSFIKNVSLA